jgi:hypothetical protein
MQPTINSWSVALVFIGGLLLSCANKELSRSEGQKISELPARLTVINQLDSSVDIYLRSGGSETFLGRVSFNETKTLQIRQPFPPGNSFLIAKPAPAAFGGRSVIRELAETLDPGDTLKWDLLLNRVDWKTLTTDN